MLLLSFAIICFGLFVLFVQFIVIPEVATFRTMGGFANKEDLKNILREIDAMEPNLMSKDYLVGNYTSKRGVIYYIADVNIKLLLSKYYIAYDTYNKRVYRFSLLNRIIDEKMKSLYKK